MVGCACVWVGLISGKNGHGRKSEFQKYLLMKMKTPALQRLLDCLFSILRWWPTPPNVAPFSPKGCHTGASPLTSYWHWPTRLGQITKHLPHGTSSPLLTCDSSTRLDSKFVTCSLLLMLVSISSAYPHPLSVDITQPHHHFYRVCNIMAFCVMALSSLCIISNCCEIWKPINKSLKIKMEK